MASAAARRGLGPAAAPFLVLRKLLSQKAEYVASPGLFTGQLSYSLQPGKDYGSSLFPKVWLICLVLTFPGVGWGDWTSKNSVEKRELHVRMF